MSTKASSVPIHLGLILDGNRRWARENGLPQLEGHREGYKNLKTIGIAALDRGVQHVSAYVFSTENWKRSKAEVSYLMNLLIWVAKHEVDELHKKGVRLRFLGSREGLSKRVLSAIDSAIEKTKNNNNGTLALCMNYGGHLEIADAFKKIDAARIPAEDITPELIGNFIYEPDIPPVDLIIRTSGEQRLSNFMLWRAAYSELCFVDKYWPAFTVQDLDDCLKDYKKRLRRFGA